MAALVKKRGPKLGYTFAYADNRDTYKGWMTAAGQGGIPCSFVVDGAGKIAYIGHPMYLDVVLPKVVDGSWKTRKDEEKLAAVEKEVDAVFAGLGGSDAKESLEKLETFENRNPALAHIPYFLGPKLSLLVKAGKSAEARKFAEQVVKKAREQEDPTALGAVSRALRADKEHKELQAVALEAAQAMLQVSGDKDWRALLNLAETQLALGEGEKALETARKALEVADSPAIKRYLEGRLKTFEPKKEEK